jgi:hypothetical protein
MADHTNGPLGLPAAVAKAVGPERAKKAGDAARLAVSNLDRDNHWTQEPAHVYRAGTWKASKGETGQ